jgi:hypothetical protein
MRWVNRLGFVLVGIAVAGAAMQVMNRAMKARAEAIDERAKIDAEALGN